MSAAATAESPRVGARRLFRLAPLLLVLAAAAAMRAHLGWSEVGIYWPDEVYQSLEPGHRVAFGYGMRAWEFIDGARNWTFPALISVVMKLASLLGLDDPARYLWLLRMVFAATGVLATWGVYRLARMNRVPESLAVASAALLGLGAVPLYFAHRAMSETGSLAPVIWGLVLLLEDREPGRPRDVRRAIGASLLGLSTLIRLQNGLFCAGVLLILLARRRWRDALVSGVVLAGWALLFGVIDKLTWGAFFHSALKYIQFNVIEGKAAGWGTAPFTYYPRYLWESMQGPSLVLALSLPFALRRAPGLWLVALAFVLVHGFTPHKELRFILPVLPLLFALGAIGVDVLLELVSAPVLKPVLAVGVGVIAVQSGAQARALTFGQVGAYVAEKPQASAWGDSASVNRLLLAAHRQADLCALKVEPVHLAWAGGQSYLHRPVRLYSHAGPPRQLGFYNYVVTVTQATSGLEVVAVDGPFALARLPLEGCREDPGFSDRLP